MTTRKSKFLALLTAVSLAAPLAAFAQQRPQPPEMPTAKIASALGVSEAAVTSCLPGAGAKGEAPRQGKAAGKASNTPQHARPDATTITTCLQAENSSLTNAQVEKVLADFAPAPRPKRS